jgi:hypothetical protein
MNTMKKLLWVALAFPFFAYQCDKTAKDGWLEGKVVRISCASYIIQVTNSDAVGEDGWKDMSNNDKAYDNVFAVSNKCKMPADIKAGSAIKFKVAEPAKDSGCISCMMFDGPPKVALDVNEVSLLENAK